MNRTSNNLDYKLVLYHGPKYLNDLKLLSSRSENVDNVVIEPSAELLQSLVQRGMSSRVAKKLLESLPADQPVAAQLEWCASIIQRGRIDNPAGFMYSVLRNNEPVPEHFETSEKRNVRLKREHEDMAAYALRLEQEEQYNRYVQSAITTAISAKYSAEEYEAALKRFTPEFRKQYPNLPVSTIRQRRSSSYPFRCIELQRKARP
ncbi:MAG: hypothetical protein JO323_11160 [Acidobacteriia bacterium]|nr:hypothetical protein [Terriglobia bacterium]